MTSAVGMHSHNDKQVGDEAAAVAKLRETLERMRAAHRAKPMPTYDERMEMLSRLRKTLLLRKDAIADAIARDFGNRSRHESLIAEVFLTLLGIKHAQTHLRDWMETQEREIGWAFLPARAEVMSQPLGVIGVISPWNYPVQLALGPLVGALAAGNRVMIKPSELVPTTAELIKDLVADTFEPDQVTVITGGSDIGEAFARLPFDHLVFTGSTRVGKLVMRAASENLTPVTLELGGKSPTIVGEDYSITTAADRIMMAKLFNCGQTCIAPDYAMIPEGSRDRFVEACKAAVAKMYPTIATNPDYTAIVNERHYARLASYVDDAKKRGAQVVELNPANESIDPQSRRLLPTLVLEANDDMHVMQEEIFGPILPIKTYKSLGEAIDYVNDHPRPLALYYFGHDREKTDRVLTSTLSGGVCINDAMLQFAQEDLPFGGVGGSGIGHYHAFEGFETFSKKKPIVYQSRIAPTTFLKPPYRGAINGLLRVLLGRHRT